MGDTVNIQFTNILFTNMLFTLSKNILFTVLDTQGVMVIIIGYGHGDTSSNPG